MSPNAQKILLDALDLSPMDRAELIEKIFASFSLPEREAIDALWASEAEDRIDAFERNEITSTPASAVFARIERGEF